jgi:hypothetical protein
MLALGPVVYANASKVDQRDEVAFNQWAATRQTEVAAFQAYLHAQGVATVVPPWQLLRTASDWQRCGAEAFALAPRAQWPAAARTLALLKVLRQQQLLGEFEVVSAWRDEALNRCAHGAAKSTHVGSFALDLLPGAPASPLCEFWKRQGAAWNMGLSRYPSGRVHVDTAGYRTWGDDYTRRSSFCYRPD